MPEAVLPGLWEFPGGRVREGESDADALARTLSDRLGVTCEVDEKLLEVRHDYPEWTVVLAVYRCALDSAPIAQRVAAVAWVEPESLGDYPFPAADAHSVGLLLGDSNDS
jgi:8-oxo-dGTP diphosphatase